MKFRRTVDFQLLTTLSGSLATKVCQHHLTEVKIRKFPQRRLPPSFKYREKKAYFGYNYINSSILMKSILFPGIAFGLLFICFFFYHPLKIRVIYYLKIDMSCFGEDAQKPSISSLPSDCPTYLGLLHTLHTVHRVMN